MSHETAAFSNSASRHCAVASVPCDGEDRYNRTNAEYMAIAARLPALKQLLRLVNERFANFTRSSVIACTKPAERCRSVRPRFHSEHAARSAASHTPTAAHPHHSVEDRTCLRFLTLQNGHFLGKRERISTRFSLRGPNLDVSENQARAESADKSGAPRTIRAHLRREQSCWLGRHSGSNLSLQQSPRKQGNLQGLS